MPTALPLNHALGTTDSESHVNVPNAIRSIAIESTIRDQGSVDVLSSCSDTRNPIVADVAERTDTASANISQVESSSEALC